MFRRLGFWGLAGLFLSAFLIASASADTLIPLASVGTAADSSQYNSSGATISIEPNSAWAAPLAGSSWVSFESTGNPNAPGFVALANGTVVDFFDVFTVPGTATGGSISVMADDSAAVYLNGVLLVPEAPSAGNTYRTCSDFGIGCVRPDVIDLPAADLQSGTNTLEFAVAQRDGSSYGLDYAGYVTDPLATPEPLSLALVGTGLLAIAFLLRRRLA